MTWPRRRNALRARVALAVFLFAALEARAHQQRLSYGDYQVHGAAVDVRLRFAAADLAPLFQLDGKFGAAELTRLEPALVQATMGELAVRSGGAACAPQGESRATLEENDGIVVVGAFRCPAPVAQLEVRLGFLERLPAGSTHLSLVAFDNQSPEQRVSQADAATFTVDRKAELGTTMLRFLRLGIEHIFTGTDHIAFLLGLLLLGGTLRELIVIVSSFTAAHSITLALAALGLVVPPPRLIEPLIALSILFVAVENIWALRSRAALERAQTALRHRWMITFAFGLVHGFGFASALRELNLPRAGLALSLVSFNLGVEAGQVCIVALAFPLLAALRRREPRVQKQVALALSAVIGALGLMWFVQRIRG